MLESLRGVRPNKAPGLNHRDLVDEDRENREHSADALRYDTIVKD